MSSATPVSKSTFEPVHPFSWDDPRSWASTLGNMDWDETHIVFTKRSLLEFLKQAGLTVGTNLTEISKLPKYASFGKFDADGVDAAVADLVEAEIADPSPANIPRPSRKVAQPPGGTTSIAFGEIEETDALSFAPAKVNKRVAGTASAIPGGKTDGAEAEDDGEVRLEHTEKIKFGELTINNDDSSSSQNDGSWRPTRKVRETPGGASQMGNLLFGGYDGDSVEDAPRHGRKKQMDQSQSSNIF